MAKNYRFYPLIFIAAFVAIFIWLAVVYMGRETQISIGESRATLDYVQTNTNAKPIASVLIKPSPCDAGYETKAIGTFQGLRQGCSCEANTIFIEGPTNQCAQEGCASVPATPSSVLYFWGNSNYVCIKRSNDVRYVNKGDTTCPSGYRRCSSQTCIGQKESCPYVDLRIVSKQSGLVRATPLENVVANHLETHQGQDSARLNPPPAGYSVPDGYGVEPGAAPFKDVQNKDKILVGKLGSETEEGDLISDITVSISGVPCVSPIENVVRVGGTEFDLEVANREGCGDFGVDDSFSKQIDQQDEKSTYITNKINTPEAFDKFLSQNKETAILVARRKISAANIVACQQVASDKLKDIDSIYSTMKSDFATFYWIFGTLLGLSIVLSLLLFVAKNIRWARVVNLILCVILFLASISLVFQGFVYLSHKAKIESNINGVLNGCEPSSPYHEAFQKMTDSIEISKRSFDSEATLLLWSGGITSIGVIIYTILICRSRIIRKGNADDQVEAMSLVVSPSRQFASIY